MKHSINLIFAKIYSVYMCYYSLYLNPHISLQHFIFQIRLIFAKLNLAFWHHMWRLLVIYITPSVVHSNEISGWNPQLFGEAVFNRYVTQIEINIYTIPFHSWLQCRNMRRIPGYECIWSIDWEGEIVAGSEQVEYGKTIETCAPCIGPILSQNNN